jgi:hypothetical protein
MILCCNSEYDFIKVLEKVFNRTSNKAHPIFVEFLKYILYMERIIQGKAMSATGRAMVKKH